MEICCHESCGRENRVWLPIDANSRSEVNLHPWCVHCGTVKNISDDRPKKIGYWMNMLSRMAGEFSIRQVQKRLISKDISSYEGFDDIYGVTGSAQKELFTKIVKKYCNIDEKSIDSFIC